MPKEIPGFYYDAAKNRYFPYKGRVPGSSSAVKPPPSDPPQLKEKKVDGSLERNKIKKRELLQARELFGNAIISRRGKISFQAEYRKRHATQPTIWKYRETRKVANVSLDHAVADVILPHGIVERDVLLGGGVNRMIQLYQIGKGKYGIDPTQIYKADRILPHNIDRVPRSKELLKQLGNSFGSMLMMGCDISCIKGLKKTSWQKDGSGSGSASASKHFVVTTLGSDHAPGSLFLLDLSTPLDFGATYVVDPDAFREIATFFKTIWYADCDPEGRHVVVGFNNGAARVNVEHKCASMVFDSRSDVLSLEYDRSGNNILCGMRNGAVVLVDIRQKPVKFRSKYPTISLKSSICCLRFLKQTDQYFLASSMDGSIKLYDQRMIQRWPLQSYEGNVNTHTRIELGVDPSEKVVMSGGEDCCVRMWDIKSGNLLYKDKFMDSIPTAVCWPGTGDVRSSANNRCYWDDHHLGVWLGSYEGIYYMDWM